MDETEFWSLVDRTREAAGLDSQRHAELLVARLAQEDPATVGDFARHFESRFVRAYRWDVWGAAWVVLDGASDDCFENFRCWLISLGRDVFEDTLRDPDSLAEHPGVLDSSNGWDGEAEEVGNAAFEAYEQLTGAELPDEGLPEVPPEPFGKPIDFEDPRVLSSAYPRLWTRFRR